MKPIPEKLLIHSAELKTVTDDNTWQEQTPTDSKQLSKIRIEPCSRLAETKDNKLITLSAVLIYDCKNSRPKNTKFQQGQKVFFNGKEYAVETIEPLYDGSKLHHIELGLI